VETIVSANEEVALTNELHEDMVTVTHRRTVSRSDIAPD